MAQEKPLLKFESNPCNNFRDNRCHRRTDGQTDGRTDGRTDDGQKSHTMSSADRVKQS